MGGRRHHGIPAPEIERDRADRGEIGHRHHGEGHAGRETAGRWPAGRCGRAPARGPRRWRLRGRGLPLLRQARQGEGRLPRSLTGDGDRAGHAADRLLQHQDVGAAPLGLVAQRQQNGGADGGVPGEGQFAAGREDAQRRAVPVSAGGCTNTVSDRLNSRAIACIAAVSSPSASSTTARGLPAWGVAVKTSSVTKRRAMAVSPRKGQVDRQRAVVGGLGPVPADARIAVRRGRQPRHRAVGFARIERHAIGQPAPDHLQRRMRIGRRQRRREQDMVERHMRLDQLLARLRPVAAEMRPALMRGQRLHRVDGEIVQQRLDAALALVDDSASGPSP